MIYLEYTQQSLLTPNKEPALDHHAVQLNVSSIAEAARLFLAFEAGSQRPVELTSIGTSKRRGVEYGRWGSL